MRSAFYVAIRSLVIALGVALAAWGVRDLLQTRELAATGQHTTGRIVAVDRRDDGERVSWFLVAEFEAPPGTPTRVEGKMGSDGAEYRVGQSVGIVYRAAHPEAARIEVARELWGPGLMGLLGAAFVLFGFGADWRTRRRAQLSEEAEEVLVSRVRWAARIARGASVIVGLSIVGSRLVSPEYRFWVTVLPFASVVAAIPAYERMRRCPRCGVRLLDRHGRRLALFGAAAPCEGCGLDVSAAR
jgi:hypothetical protein